ncbi:MAG: CBS domain-containing protein [Candidatus Bathyarchaeota archaeon]
MRVRDFVVLENIKPSVIQGDAPIEKVVEAFASHQELRGIFVVDEKERFIGVITRFELLQWTKYKLISNIETDYEWKVIHSLKQYVLSTKVSELINKNSRIAYLRLDDSIEKVLQLMTDHNLIDIPILNNEGKIIGDIKLSDLLNKIIRIEWKA